MEAAQEDEGGSGSTRAEQTQKPSIKMLGFACVTDLGAGGGEELVE